MNTIETICLIAACAIFILMIISGFTQIPRAHFGIHLRFGRRTGRILTEGLHWIFPFGIDTVEIIDDEVDTTTLEANFFTKDRVKIYVEGSLQWHPSAHITDDNGRNKFLAIDASTINVGVSNTVQSELGKLGGLIEARCFSENRHAVESFINVVLKEPGDALIRVDPFAENPLEVFTERKSKSEADHDRIAGFSKIEKRYGIAVTHFAITNIRFDGDFESALQKNQETRYRLEGKMREADAFSVFVTRLRTEQGLDAETANTTAQTLFGLAEKKVFAIEGISREALAALIAKIAR